MIIRIIIIDFIPTSILIVVIIIAMYDGNQQWLFLYLHEVGEGVYWNQVVRVSHLCLKDIF